MPRVILIVDDDQDACLSIVGVVGNRGLFLPDGDQWFRRASAARIRKSAPRDPRLPVAGSEVTEFLLRKAFMPSVKAIPVILTTAYRDIRMRDGVVAHLEKPFGIDERSAD